MLATTEGTRGYAARVTEPLGIAPGHFREAGGLTVSSIGLGTYLGEPDDHTDLMYVEAVRAALALGCNVVDTAANYRFQRSERAIGVALARELERGAIGREEIVVSTKGGYVPFDGAPPRGSAELHAYLERTFFEPGICTPAEMASRGQHCMAPRYLEHQLDQSLSNLGLDAVDIYYIHNPEGQLSELPRDEVERRLRAAFEMLERKVADGRVGRYGTATWNGYRVGPRGREHLSLERLEAIAREVGGPGHHFRVVQLPFNLAMPEAYAAETQVLAGAPRTLLAAAADLGIAVYASASLMQSRLAAGPIPELVDAFGITNPAQAALQFVRSTPGIACALVGMSRESHVRENLGAARIPVAPASTIESLFEE